MDTFYFVSECVLFFVFGLCIGSFLNVVIYRLPRGMNLAKPASHCTVCNHELAWYDNIPIVSFLILRGKCRYCATKISPRYLIVELINAVVWLLIALLFIPKYNLWFAVVAALVFSVLLTMAFCDIENLFIPDSLQICFLLLAVGAIFADNLVGWQDKLYGLLLSGGFFLFFWCASFWLFQREGLGFGDVKLMACAGLFLGWKAACVAIVLAILAALVAVVIRKLSHTERLALADDGEFAFAPFLCWGTVAAMLFGNELMALYLNFLIA